MTTQPPQTLDSALSPATTTTTGNRWRLIKYGVIASLLILHFVASGLTVVPGYLSIDEAIYHWMVKNLADGRGLEIWTGYGEFPSIELVHYFLLVHQGKVVAQYPQLFVALGLPFYMLFGFYGLFLVNAIAFLGAVALCGALAYRLFGELDLALNSVLILLLATFFWEYSQAGWPHMTATLFMSGVFFLGVCSFYGESAKARIVCSFMAGLIAGFAAGLRLDSFLIFVPVALMFLFAKQTRVSETLALFTGAIPGLTILTMTNYLKFGVIHPFSNGFETGLPLNVLLPVAILLVGVWFVTRFEWYELLSRHKVVGMLIAVALVAGLMLLPTTGELLRRGMRATYMMVVDLRIRDPGAVEWALTRSFGGGLVYLGAQKKSLIQSMPYLVVLIVPLAHMVCRKSDAVRLGLLFLPVAVVVGFFSHRQDHGGLSLNLRYFLPILPYLAILSAYAIRAMASRFGMKLGVFGVVLNGVATSCFFLAALLSLTTVDQQEYQFVIVPLMLAGMIIGLLVAGTLFRVTPGTALFRANAVMLVAALVWSGLTAFFYDYPIHRRQRVINYVLGRDVAGLVAPDSVLFAFPVIDPFMGLVETPKVRMAFPARDLFKDFRGLVEFYLARGHPVYAAFPQRVWDHLQHMGTLSSYRMTPLLSAPSFVLAQIRLE